MPDDVGHAPTFAEELAEIQATEARLASRARGEKAPASAYVPTQAGIDRSAEFAQRFHRRFPPAVKAVRLTNRRDGSMLVRAIPARRVPVVHVPVRHEPVLRPRERRPSRRAPTRGRPGRPDEDPDPPPLNRPSAQGADVSVHGRHPSRRLLPNARTPLQRALERMRRLFLEARAELDAVEFDELLQILATRVAREIAARSDLEKRP